MFNALANYKKKKKKNIFIFRRKLILCNPLYLAPFWTKLKTEPIKYIINHRRHSPLKTYKYQYPSRLRVVA